MRAEYKRDMNHNYLILYGEDEINTDSYQVRMLVGNVIPSLLKCRIQGMDGRFLVYFDITSKQALSVLYEEKKMGVEASPHLWRLCQSNGGCGGISDESRTIYHITGIYLYRY